MAKFDHLQVVTPGQAREFKSNLNVVKAPPAPRDRVPHGEKLLAQLAELRERQAPAGPSEDADESRREGMAIVLEIKPRGFLDFSKLDWSSDKIELLNVVDGKTSDTVVLFVPDGRLDALEERVRKYLYESKDDGSPRMATLVNVIENIRSAAFDELWTDKKEAPRPAEQAWLQIWLRLRPDGPQATYAQFAEICARLKAELEPGYLTFPGRVVVAMHASRLELESDIHALDAIAEIRLAEETAEFYLADLTPADQMEWVRNLLARTTHRADSEAGAYVTLLDTGVAHSHPLLDRGIASADLHAIADTWITTDHSGHGTQMAGLVLHGNLVGPLSSEDQLQVDHRLESVTILPPTGMNPPHLYGWITQEAARRVETPHPERRRAFAMPVTAEGQTTGTPSEWSAAIDQLAFDAVADEKAAVGHDAQKAPRLFVISAGNVPWSAWGDYPAINMTSTVESPGQAWNAITVGACTHLVEVDAARWPTATVLAQEGELSPSSTTSLIWHSAWPFKPDVVAEGGNGCRDRDGVIAGPDSVRVLTTQREYTQSLLTDSGDTSAATAEVARLCARVSHRYPAHWPETVRALVIHGARYTAAMRAGLPKHLKKEDKRNLVRRFGYGAVSDDVSLASSEQRPTLIVQESIHPYRRDKSSIRLNEMKVHDLPWPADVLAALGEAKVELRITLSYFIDPNPSQRGWLSKFRYQSHGLRYAVQAATESEEEFHQRINKIDRDAAAAENEEDAETSPDPDAGGWLLGSQMRNRGSIHSDVWKGTAAELATKSRIAVFPVGGWWKDWRKAGRPESSVRYALVVSLEVSEDIDVDLYTPIATKLGVPVVVEIDSQ